MILQIRTRVGTAIKGSMIAVAGSGIRSMSDSWIAWKPRIDDPSNPTPSVNRSSVNSRLDMEKCCHRPGRSINLRSTIFTPRSFASLITSFGVIGLPFLLLGLNNSPLNSSCSGRIPRYRAPSNRRFAPLAGPNSDDLIDRHNEDLAVSDAARLRRRQNRLDHLIALVVRNHDLDLHLG